MPLQQDGRHPPGMKLVQFGIKSQDKAGLSARIELITPAWEEPGKQRDTH